METDIPGLDGITMRADNHIFDVNCAKADDLTEAEQLGRQKAYALERLIRKYDNPACRIVSLCSHIGIRETYHYKTDFTAEEQSLLTGVLYDDAILNGTYRVDRHHSEDNGITFKYLDGREESLYGKGDRRTLSNWREAQNLTGECAKFYQVPFSILVQRKCANLIGAGRMLNADEGAFGALRVMVNLNQLGEAAGVAAYTALNSGCAVWDLDGRKIRQLLKAGGSAL